MIRRLPSFTLFPYTTLFRSLMAVVLDGETVLHEIDDPALLAHVDRAATLFREKTLKREYFATLPEGGKARALVVYWRPLQKEFNLWEHVKTFPARALRLARAYHHPRSRLAARARG